MIDSRVFITMTNKTTIRASEYSLTQRHIDLCSTSTASLTATSCLGVLPEFSTASYCFVGEHLIESTPRHIEYMLGEIAVNHTLNIQPLTCYDFEISCQGMAQFVQEISPLVSDLQMLPRNLESGFLSVPATLDTLGMYPLQSSQFPLSVEIESGIGDGLTFIVSQELLQPDINSNLGFGMRMLNNRNINLTGEHSKILTCFVSLDGQGLYLAFWQSMENDWHRANLGHLQPLIAEKLESRLRVCDALYPALESRKTSLDFSALLFELEPVEKVIKCLCQPIRDILQDLRMDLGIVFRTGGLDVKHKAIEPEFVGYPEFLIEVKQSVIDILADRELIENPDLLFPRGIQPELIHPEFHSPLRTQQVFKSCGEMSSG